MNDRQFRPGDVSNGWVLTDHSTEHGGWEQLPVTDTRHPDYQPIGAGTPLVPNTTTPTPRTSHRVRNAILIALAVLAAMVACSVAVAGQAGNDPTDRATTAPSFGTDPATAEPAPAPSAPVAAPAPAPPAPPAEPELTVSQENAVGSAQDYLEYTAFSRIGLIKQLEYEGFPTEEATFAVDRIGADWNAQAAASAQQYLDNGSFSRSGLLTQLEFEGFTAAEAEYGVSQVGL